MTMLARVAGWRTHSSAYLASKSSCSSLDGATDHTNVAVAGYLWHLPCSFRCQAHFEPFASVAVAESIAATASEMWFLADLVAVATV